ncbi:MAG: LpxI family protein [Deltaproteobacteria bacterium]|nr:LpxI family protein [Deltaproteobacteria bacterium]
MKQAIGLIAGNTKLPALLAQNIRAAGHRVVAVGHIGETRKDLKSFVDILHWVQIGELGKIINLLLQEGVKRAIFAGGVAKTHFFSRAKPDLRAIKVLSQLPDRKDDAILRAIAWEIESEGIRVESPAAFLKEAMAPKGCWTERQPTEREKRDLDFGWKIAKKVGRLDVGQSVVVKDQMVLAVEAIEGTNKAIRRGGKLGRGDVVVIKVSKPRQDLRLDLPVIGLSTIHTLKKAGASALAVEAGRTIVVDMKKVIREADRNKLCLMGI